MDVQVIRLTPSAIPPMKSTFFSAGLDFCANETIMILPGETKKISTGISMYWSDPNVFLKLESRSGMAAKYNIFCEAGVIDYDYQQEIFVLLLNNGDMPYQIMQGDKIAQGLFIQQPMLNTFKVNVNGEQQEYLPIIGLERNGGFGSTGV